MREDISEIIIERPRRGSYRRHKDIHGIKGHYQKDKATWASGDHITKEKMSIANNGHEGKELNENLSPLKRFIESKVNHLWDKVYSEISENISLNSAVQLHIIQHVYDFIKKDVYKEKDGKIFRVYLKENASYSARRHKIELSKGDIYVDPDDNIVKKYKWGKDKNIFKHKIEGRIKVKDNQWIIRFVDKWYFCSFKVFDGTYNEIDAFVGKIWKKERIREYDTFNHISYRFEYVTIPKFNSIAQVYPGYKEYGYYLKGYGLNSNRVDVYCSHKREMKKEELRKWGIEL